MNGNNQKTINQLSSEYGIDSQRIRRFVRNYHMDKTQKGKNNAILIDDNLEKIIIEHFGVNKQSDNQSVNHYERLIIELNNRIADKEKAISDKDGEIAFLRKKLDDADRKLENQQVLMAKLMPPEPEPETVEVETVAVMDADAVDPEPVKEEKPEPAPEKRGFFSRLFGN